MKIPFKMILYTAITLIYSGSGLLSFGMEKISNSDYSEVPWNKIQNETGLFEYLDSLNNNREFSQLIEGAKTAYSESHGSQLTKIDAAFEHICTFFPHMRFTHQTQVHQEEVNQLQKQLDTSQQKKNKALQRADEAEKRAKEAAATTFTYKMGIAAAIVLIFGYISFSPWI